MKRNITVSRLMKEGFSEKTLVNFTDKQLSELSIRIFNESVLMLPKNDPDLENKVKAAKGQNKTIETYEEKSIKCDDCEELKKDCKCDHTSLKDKKDWKKLKKESIEAKKWINKLAEEKFHSFTSKNEIMELIQSKLSEIDSVEPQYGSKVKKGHNGVPEFMTYDSIVASSSEPATKPKVKPGTKPAPTKDPRKFPHPGPGPNPKPKALKETK